VTTGTRWRSVMLLRRSVIVVAPVGAKPRPICAPWVVLDGRGSDVWAVPSNIVFFPFHLDHFFVRKKKNLSQFSVSKFVLQYKRLFSKQIYSRLRFVEFFGWQLPWARLDHRIIHSFYTSQVTISKFHILYHIF
jgi:hypothetical protein